MGRRYTRRAVLGGALAAVGTTAAPAIALDRLTAPLLDSDVDVVVVGAGAAGFSAALGAHRADPSARILLLEARPIHGGTSSRSGGRIWIPNNSDMRAAGFDDPRDMALKYMARLAYPDLYDPGAPNLGLDPRHHRQLEAYYDNGAEIFDHYRDEGILGWEVERFLPFPWNADPLGMTGEYAPDYHPDLEENVPKRGRSVIVRRFEPTGLADAANFPLPNYGASLAGVDMAQWLLVACLQRGIQIQLGARVIDLVTSRSDGLTVVEGVRVAVAVDDVTVGVTRTVLARRGVVFASGGFSKDRERLDAEFTGDRAFNGGGCAVPTAQGDLVDIAGRHGIALENMDQAWFIQNIYEQYKLDPDSRTQANFLLFQAYWLNGDSMVVVNRNGIRVVNEKTNYDTRTRVHFEPDNRFLLCVMDQSCVDRYLIGLGGQLTPMVQTLIGPADTTEGLRAAILERFDTDPALASFGLADDFATNLDGTLERFEGFARAGRDEDFARGESSVELWWHSISLYFQNFQVGDVPIVADPISSNVDEDGRPFPNPMMRPLRPPYYAVILSQGLQDTKGGPAIDEHGRILAADGQPVPGLFGAGNAVASPSGAAYWGGGGTLGPAIVFGHLAGRAAATRTDERT